MESKPGTTSDGNTSTTPPVRSGAKLAAQPSIGKVGRFELKSVLGRGGFGVVYRAFDPLLDRQVALKVPAFEKDAKKEERFLREAKAAARLRHPNIVAVFESGRAGEQLFIASEYIDGQPLNVAIEEKKPDHRTAVRWIRDMAEALAYAHSEGIVHRDIKPGNALLDQSGRPQILDFGLAKRLDDDSAVTVEGGVLGTPSYMSPEQARGARDVGPAADQYSLGVVLYELLAGRKPFTGSMEVVITQHLKNEPPALQSADATIPKDLEAICLKTLEKKPEDRYVDCGALAADLDAWLRGEPTKVRPLSRQERLFRWAKREPALAGSIAAVIVVVAGAFVAVTQSLRHATLERAKAEEQRAIADKMRSTAVEASKLAEANATAERLARQDANRQLYDTRLALAQGAWSENRINRCRELLASVVPKNPADEDLRDWEWRYLDRQCNQEAGHCAFAGQLYVPSPVGDRCAVLGNRGSNFAIYVYVWNNPKEIGTMRGHTAEVWAAAYSPDGRRIASASADRSVIFWDAEKFRPLWRVQGVSHSARGNRVTFTADGRRFAAGGPNGVVVFDATDGPAPAPVYCKGGGFCRAAAISSDGQFVCGANENGMVRFWNGATGAQVGSIKLSGSAGDVCPLAGTHRFFVRVSYELALVDADSKRTIWRTRTPAEAQIGPMAWWPSRDVILFSGDDGVVRAAKASDGAITMEFKGHHRPVESIALLPDEQSFVCSDMGAGQGRIFDLASVRNVVKSRSGFSAYRLGFSESGWAANTSSFSPQPSTASLIDLSTFKVQRKIGDNSARIDSVSLTNDGRLLCTGDNAGNINVYRIEDGVRIASLRADRPRKEASGSVFAVATATLDPSGKFVAANGVEGKMRLWNLESGKLLHEWPTTDRSAIVFSPDSRRLYGASNYATGKIYDVQSGAATATVVAKGLVRTAAFSKDGTQLVGGDQSGYVTIWNPSDGAIRLRVFAHGGMVFNTEFSSSGRRLVTGGADNHIKLWDITTGQELLGFDGSNAWFQKNGEKLVVLSNSQFFVYDPRPLTPQLRLQLRAEDLIESLATEGASLTDLQRRIDTSKVPVEIRALAKTLAANYSRGQP